MKSLMKIMAACSLVAIMSCNKFLDVVPNDTPTLDHAFSNRSVMERFMRTCYSGLPDPTDPLYYPAYFTSTDEFDWMTETRAGNSMAGMISKGLQNPNAPYQDYWSGRQGGKAMYTAIRDCNIFLENAHIPRDIIELERTRWIAEVKFLKAYYHFFLMQLYGPIVLVKENLPISATPEQSRLYREPVDECVDYIVALLDEAMPDLPLVLPDPITEQGRITQCIALSVKAKVLAWAASPLFNGNTDYAGWEDNRGKQLVSQTYDSKKWERAATAIKEALDACHSAGYRLYHFNKFTGGAQTFAMNDTLVREMTIRKAITETLDKNTGVIWATQEQFGDGKGNATNLGYNILGNMLRMFFPFLYATDQSAGISYYSASWHCGELFYSNNGVPIEEDKYFDYANRYKPRTATPADNHQSYIATNEATATLHFNREPRFYASLGFDRGFFELSTTTTNGGLSFSPFFKNRTDEIRSGGGPVAYTPKKIIPFESSASQGINGRGYSAAPYQFPLIRLSDLYLLYSEALNETKAAPDGDVYYWIDSVRAVAGLKSVVQSWQDASLSPDKARTKDGMRDIIRKERLIELVFEGQRFWDIRRWKIARDYWTLPRMSWGREKTDVGFYTPMIYNTSIRNVSFKDYLYPISYSDLRANPNLVQTYGW
jgi:hypothetical protein